VTKTAKFTLLQRFFIAPIRFYQRVLSPLKGAPTCRFEPSCSSYMLRAIEVHGAFKGVSMGVWRILKCHPLHPGGYDPVPPRKRLNELLDGALLDQASPKQLSDEAKGKSQSYTCLVVDAPSEHK
jgi:uncharacterized protein